MLEYLIKSAACLILFYGGYRLLLQNTSLHLIKRIYLLAGVIGSLLIPLVTFTTYIPAPTEQQIVIQTLTGTAQESTGIDWTFWGWTIYFAGVLLMGVRFLRNLKGMFFKISHNERNLWPDHWKVLLGDPTVPHTFLRYIFLNRDEYHNREIPNEVLLHEQAHARQWHTLDLIGVELLHVILWFNPMIPLFKRAIKLNHEFLADQAVIEQGIPKERYQHTLLAFSSSATVPPLAHAINYSSFKKRFTVMKTQTSKTQGRLRLLLLLPLAAIMLFSFSNKEVAYLEEAPITLAQEGATKKQIKEYNKLARKYNEMDPENMFIKKKDVDRMEYLYGLMTQAQKNSAQPFPSLPAPPPPPPPPANTKVKSNDQVAPPPPPPAPDPDGGQVIEVIEVPSPGNGGSNSFVVKEIAPPPPPPPNPLDHIIQLAKEDADFYYEGKSISSDKAIHLVRKNDYLNIQVKDCTGKRTEVRITKNPIKLP